MPAYEIEYLTDPSTIFVTVHSDYHFADHQRNLASQIIDLLDQTTEITYLVVDMLEFKVDWSTMIAGLGDAKWGDLRRPNCKALIAVTNNEMLKFGMKALSQFQYGGFRVAVFSNMDEARDYVDNLQNED